MQVEKEVRDGSIKQGNSGKRGEFDKRNAR